MTRLTDIGRQVAAGHAAELRVMPVGLLPGLGAAMAKAAAHREEQLARLEALAGPDARAAVEQAEQEAIDAAIYGAVYRGPDGQRIDPRRLHATVRDPHALAMVTQP